eukprot:3426390-Alexandrium_andersonii.AAC.1
MVCLGRRAPVSGPAACAPLTAFSGLPPSRARIRRRSARLACFAPAWPARATLISTSHTVPRNERA